jgi:hypothetical protein
MQTFQPDLFLLTVFFNNITLFVDKSLAYDKCIFKALKKTNIRKNK